MEQPIIEYHKREGRFMLRTDACLGDKDNVGGLGAVLLQQQKTAEDEDKVCIKATEEAREELLRILGGDGSGGVGH
jgi:hypothetical protein